MALVVILNRIYRIDILIYVWIDLTCLIVSIYFYGVFEPKNNLFVKTIKGKDFFISDFGLLYRFDDGPHPVYTPKILDILKSYNIKGVFAVTGENCEKHPEILKRIADENHIVANHSYSHPYLISLFSTKKLYREIKKANDIIEDISQKKVLYYCPPLGHKSLSLNKVMKKLNLKVMAWDIRTYDTKLSADSILKKIHSGLKNKSIILFHDGVYKWTNENRDETIKALKACIESILRDRLMD